MRNLSESRLLTLCLLALLALVLLFAHQRGDMQAACDRPFVALNLPALPRVNERTLAALNAYFAERYGDDGKQRVLAFYTDYEDILAVLGGRLARPYLLDYSGFTMRRVGWNADTCRYDRASRVKANISMVSTRFTDGTLFGLILHELAHGYGRDGHDPAEVESASWWERVGGHAYAGTCAGQPEAARAPCVALAGLIAAHEDG